jgi:predicted Fe-Mo cluster-binding NifX family protein
VLPLALGRLDAFITAGMGEGLFARLQAAQVRPYITTEKSPAAAVAALLAGTLVSGAPHAHAAGHHH